LQSKRNIDSTGQKPRAQKLGRAEATTDTTKT